MTVVKYKRIWYGISAILLALSVWAVFAYGFNLSIDFTGGTLTEVRYTGEKPTSLDVEGSVRSTEDGFIIRSKTPVSQEVTGGEIVRQNSIGPTAGAELRSKAVKAVVVVVVMIVLFVTFAFRKVSRPVSSWKYGLATIIALAHDVIIPVGIFVLLGKEIDLLFVTGLLAILGYSVHDTIVVFDRVRENLSINQEKNIKEDFETTVGKSVSQTLTRSINTSITIFITLLALYLFGSSATAALALLLIVGLIAGTYSSIFIASPLLVTFYKLQKK